MSIARLIDILATQNAALEAAYAKIGKAAPDLETPERLGVGDSDFEVARIRQTLVAAANQIIQTVRPAGETLLLETFGVLSTNALGIAEEFNIADVIAEAGPEGLHVDAISAKAGLDVPSVERILRYLATRHIFKEVKPNVFVNNRISELMRKNKPLKEIIAKPNSRYENSSLATAISLVNDDFVPVAPYLSKFVRDPGEWETPFNMAHQTQAKLWDWYGQPGNEYRMNRFAAFMKSAGSEFPEEIISDAIAALSLPPGSVVVDLGASTGHATLTMYRSFPNLKYIVEDLPELESVARNFWNSEAPEALTNGTVTIKPHSFLEPQPVKNASVYFFRVTLHNWPDKKVVDILRHLRDAAGPNSKLVALEAPQGHTCVMSGQKSQVPEPLLENLGIGGTSLFGPLDLQMWIMFNARERTEENFRSIGAASGWKLESAKPGILTTYTFSVV
ncbi:S-adenosyl-L-methionine-dependent methyltransferase [Cylindrobasidium torrendii FP15055 ss-10]|uniref:S-adenosyl-L-methionine-dependent methyltransferase n=1 Tax=Cylindrobasidium torrendii FP15055 ss-10 TaxID=1314674 RepID=A0A0D7B9V4_9AGAR|nr:S-adenosyl-L-methionine-dependent methyltransferase [Cylindrobasidium torrendii FP15055 ss-10]